MLEHINSWSKRAKCRDIGVEVFFSRNLTKQGKRFCRDSQCPVLYLCKTYAIVHNEYGVWGGTTRYERDSLDKDIVDIIRQLYYQEGLLEYRPIGPVADFLSECHQEEIEQKQELQQGRSYPNVALEAS
jgi:hypothetical protein